MQGVESGGLIAITWMTVLGATSSSPVPLAKVRSQSDLPTFAIARCRPARWCFWGLWAGQAVTFNRAERAIATIKDGPTRSQLFTWAGVEREVGPSIPARPRDC